MTTTTPIAALWRWALGAWGPLRLRWWAPLSWRNRFAWWSMVLTDRLAPARHDRVADWWNRGAS